MHLCKHGCDVLDLFIFPEEKNCKSNYSQEHFFPVYIASSKHLRVEKFPKVMQTFQYRSGFHNCLELSEPPNFSDKVMRTWQYTKAAIPNAPYPKHSTSMLPPFFDTKPH